MSFARQYLEKDLTIQQKLHYLIRVRIVINSFLYWVKDLPRALGG